MIVFLTEKGAWNCIDSKHLFYCLPTLFRLCNCIFSEKQSFEFEHFYQIQKQGLMKGLLIFTFFLFLSAITNAQDCPKVQIGLFRGHILVGVYNPVDLYTEDLHKF